MISGIVIALAAAPSLANINISLINPSFEAETAQSPDTITGWQNGNHEVTGFANGNDWFGVTATGDVPLNGSAVTMTASDGDNYARGRHTIPFPPNPAAEEYYWFFQSIGTVGGADVKVPYAVTGDGGIDGYAGTTVAGVASISFRKDTTSGFDWPDNTDAGTVMGTLASKSFAANVADDQDMGIGGNLGTAIYKPQAADIGTEIFVVFATHASNVTGGDPMIGVDNAVVSIVPEPATLTLLAMGGLGMLLRRRRE